MGQLIRFAITGGEVADITQAKALLVGSAADTVVADKGYDSDQLVDFIREGEAVAAAGFLGFATRKRYHASALE